VAYLKIDDGGEETALADEFIFNNYDQLEKSGLFKRISNLDDEVKLYKKIVQESIDIINCDSVESLARMVSQILMDKFIPSFIGFVSQEDLDSNTVSTIFYKNLKPADAIIEVKSIARYNDIFKITQTAMTFEAFKYIAKDPALINPFIPVSPKIIVPMMGQNELYGMIILGDKVVSGEYNGNDITFINTIISYTSIALQNIIHYKRAIMDLKTRMYNYSYFVKRLFEEISRIKRYKNCCTVALIDIDNFRDVNNKYGHKAGDKVIRSVASIIKACLRESDIAARYGGEEFGVLLVQTRIPEAVLVMDRIRKNIEKEQFVYEDYIMSITISLGLTFIHQDADSLYIDEILKKADNALYKSKIEGRNRITIF